MAAISLFDALKAQNTLAGMWKLIGVVALSGQGKIKGLPCLSTPIRPAHSQGAAWRARAINSPSSFEVSQVVIQ